VGDVAEVLAQNLERRTTIGKVYDLVSPKEYTYGELARLARDALESRKPLVSFPMGFFRLVSRLPFAPITRDQPLILLEGNTGDPAKLQAVFELEWRWLEAELPRVRGIRYLDSNTLFKRK